MELHIRNALGAMLAVVVFTLAIMECEAQDVKYCRDANTGEIIVVEAGQPCPYPTHEL